MAIEGDLDVLVIGAGYGGVHTLYNLRKAGLKVKVFERGSNFGGTWYWNRYPGARVDSDGHIYQFSDENIWKNWDWKERFPDHTEIREYFAFLDKEWDLKKDVIFNKEVVAARFNEEINKWDVTSQDGDVVRCRWLIAAVGFASKQYIPPFKGVDAFKGELYHTSRWPRSGVNLKGKKVAVIGTGASGVQVIQEIAADVEHLTVYQRTPNLALPMVQESWTEFKAKRLAEKDAQKWTYENLPRNFAAFHFNFLPKDAEDDTPDERRAAFENAWNWGGFKFWVGVYKDIFLSDTSNRFAYDFWAEKTRERIKDPKKKDILAPLTPLHPFGTKRPSLEQHYYEEFNRESVDIIDVTAYPIEEFTENGIKTSHGHVEVDVIVLATGFDTNTGGLTQIDIRGTDGVSLKERWADGVESFLGMSVARYPNLFYIYAAQAPTAFANGPTCVEIQGNWIEKLVQDMHNAGVERVEATENAQKDWVGKVNTVWNSTLFPYAKSWYQGANIPGKPIQALNWAAGMPAYVTEITTCRDNDYEGFVKSRTPDLKK